jgi:dCTP deaminase
MSYLSDREIEKAIADGLLVIDPPVTTAQYSPCGIDLHLGASVWRPPDPATAYEIKPSSIKARPQEVFPEESMATGHYDLKPGEFMLGVTFERVAIAPGAELIGFIEGRSGVARHGLLVHCTAPIVQPGWSGPITLELVNLGKYPLPLRARDGVCQMVFARLGTPTSRPYSSQTQQQPGFAGGNGKIRTAAPRVWYDRPGA